MTDFRGLETASSVEMAAIRVRQPIGDFFLASIKSTDLFKIAFFDIRQLYSENGIDDYLGIQRVLNSKRVEEIRHYVSTVDATFPTGVVLAVDERCAELVALDCGSEFESSIFKLTLRNVPEPTEGEEPVLFRQIARVIDGQHRIAGLESYSGPPFDVNVAIFVGLDIASQASIFSVVNLAQTKVNPSLVYDLFAYDRARSPEKTCHELAVALDSAPSSPFHNRIKRLGVATQGRFGETLSQATFVRSLLPYISNDVMRDRDVGRRGGKLPMPTKEESQRLIFRTMFIQERDRDIGAIIWAYFAAIAERWPGAWNSTQRGFVLNKTTGFQGFMRFLRDVYQRIALPNTVPQKAAFVDVLRRVNIGEADFNTDNFKPGSSGVASLLETLRADTGFRREQ